MRDDKNWQSNRRKIASIIASAQLWLTSCRLTLTNAKGFYSVGRKKDTLEKMKSKDRYK